MYAIIDVSGRQEKVEKDVDFSVNRMDAKVGDTVKLPNVLFALKNHAYHIGKPYIKDASVECEVVSHGRDKKVLAFKYKSKKSYTRMVGHRQDITVLKVKEIHIP
ncbi:MAG: 50S ribosomal protein L21 [Candidatus Omnitrophica bacterium]|nr:50S ribosomal protein L21 [Candidatus Omnitrophota bacterium]